MKRRHPFALFFLLAGLLGCGHDQVAGGGGTLVGSAKGRVMRQDGTPAAGVVVRIYPVNANPLFGIDSTGSNAAVSDSVVTDAAGEFDVFLQSGLYNMFAETGDLGSYQDSLTADEIASIVDTIKPLGSVQGRVLLENQDDPKTVFMVAFGSRSWSASNSEGRVVLSRMPEGEYRVRIFSTLDQYEPLDTTIAISSGQDDTLMNPVRLRYTGIPVPTGLKIQYDSMVQVVTLAWQKPSNGRPISGYVVYRADTDSGTLPIALNAKLVTDTMYRDSGAVQGRHYQYCLAAVDTGNTFGTKSQSVAVEIRSAYKLAASFGAGQGSGAGQFAYLKSVAVDANGNVYTADVGNHRIQKFDSAGTFLLGWGSRGSGPGEFNEPTDLAIDSSGDIYVADRYNHRIQRFSENGTYMGQWGARGSGAGNFEDITSIAINKGSIYVSDHANQCVQEFDLAGRFIRKIAIHTWVQGVYANDSLLLVIAHDHDLVLKYSIEGSLLDTVYDASRTAGYGVLDIFIANGSQIWLTYPTQNGVLGYDLSGQMFCRFTMADGKKAPQDIWVSNGAIFVAPYIGGPIQKYIPR